MKPTMSTQKLSLSSLGPTFGQHLAFFHAVLKQEEMEMAQFAFALTLVDLKEDPVLFPVRCSSDRISLHFLFMLLQFFEKPTSRCNTSRLLSTASAQSCDPVAKDEAYLELLVLMTLDQPKPQHLL